MPRLPEHASLLQYIKGLHGMVESERVGSAVVSYDKRQSLLEDVEQIDLHNRQSQQLLQKNLEYLTRETVNYEARLKEYREQLRQREILNEKMYSRKVLEMLEEYEIMKDRCDEIKGENFRKLLEEKALADAFINLLRQRWYEKIMRTKRIIVERKALRDLLANLLRNLMTEGRVPKDTLAEMYRTHRLKQHVMNALKYNWYRNKLDYYNKLPPQRIIIKKDKKMPRLEYSSKELEMDVEPEWSVDEDEEELGDNVDAPMPNLGLSSIQGSVAGSRMIIEELEENQPLYFKIPAPELKRTTAADGTVQVHSNEVKHVHVNIAQEQYHVHGHHKVYCTKHRSPLKEAPSAQKKNTEAKPEQPDSKKMTFKPAYDKVQGPKERKPAMQPGEKVYKKMEGDHQRRGVRRAPSNRGSFNDLDKQFQYQSARQFNEQRQQKR